MFEDLHWIDGETQALLDSLVESLRRARVLLLVNYRPEYQHPWGSKTYYAQLRLDPLPAEGAGRSCSRRSRGATPDSSRSSGLLVERTEGNPFFLEESVRTLVETRVFGRAIAGGGILATAGRRPSRCRRRSRPWLAARIDRLPPEEKQLLQSAAVIGKDVSLALLSGDHGARRGEGPPRPLAPPGGRVSVRDALFSGSRV